MRVQGGGVRSIAQPCASAISLQGLRSAECSQPQPRSIGNAAPSSIVQARPPSRGRASTIRQAMPASLSRRRDPGRAAADNHHLGVAVGHPLHRPALSKGLGRSRRARLRKLAAVGHQVRIQSGSGGQQICVHAGSGGGRIRFNLTLVTPHLRQSKVEYLIHFRTCRLWRRIRRIASPRRPVLVLTKPGVLPRARPSPWMSQARSRPIPSTAARS